MTRQTLRPVDCTVGSSSHWLRSGRAGRAVFLLALPLSWFAIAALSVLDGRAWVLLAALGFAALLWALERQEARQIPEPRRAWRGYRLPVLLIFLATFAAYFPSLRVGFNSDAIAYIHVFHVPSLSQFLRLFHTDLSQGAAGVDLQELRPLYGLSYMLGYALWGLHPLGYHVGGILVHVLNALLVFLIARNLADGDPWRGWLAALLFALLPVNAENLGSINGTLTEGVPTGLYLLGFLGFIRYRQSGMARWLAGSSMAFAACLLSKETGVTLPVMLGSYDLFRIAAGDYPIRAAGSPAGWRKWPRLLLPYAPFVVLLAAYLTLRRLAFPSFLRENAWSLAWGGSGPGGGGGLIAFIHQLAHLGRFGASLQAYNLRSLLLAFSPFVVGLILGLYLVWSLSVARHRSECRRTIDAVVYVGLGWYLIASLPLLAVHASAGHLYLPSVGLCLATAFLAVPTCEGLRGRVGRVRLAGAGLLVCLSGSLLWNENVRWARTWEQWLGPSARIAATMQDLPTDGLVVVWYGGSGVPPSRVVEEYLPYALQPPFTTGDLYSRANVVEAPEMFCCPRAQWWDKSRRVLARESSGAPGDGTIVSLLAWDWRNGAFERRSRAVPKAVLRACLVDSLGEPPEARSSLSPDSSDRLMEALARLVVEGGESSLTNVSPRERVRQ